MEALNQQLIRIALLASVALVSTALSAAPTSATPPTQTGGGGGDKLPPNLPPTKYFGSAGGADAAGRVSPSARVQTFDLYQLDPVKNPIYYEGQQAVTQDANGKEIRYQRVFQFLSVSQHSVGMEIRRGLLLPDAHYLDSHRVEWSPNQYSLGELMLEVANERSKSFRRTLSVKGPVATTPKGAFELYLVAADGMDVYFEGKKDGQGRERVFRQTLNSAYIDRGYIENIERGEIKWSEPNTPRGKALADIAQVIAKEAPEGIRKNIAKSEAAQPKINDPRAGRQYPNYPEVKNAEKAPLPRSQSLVVTDGKITEHSPYHRSNAPPSGSGLAEVSSPYRATLDPLTETYGGEMWKAGRPSSLNGTLEWSQLKGRRLTKAVHEFVDGKPRKAVEKAGKATVELTRTSANFYLAMGLLTSYTLAMDYANNPRAWSAYLETGTDPVFYLSLGAFMAASEPFFRKMGPMNGPAKTVLPRFMGAIMVGGIASHIVSQILYDPNFRKCHGFTSFSTTGTFVRDYAACDALYDKWANYQLDNELGPLIANLGASSAFFYTSLRALKAIASRTAVQNALGTVVRVFKVPPSTFARGGWQTIGMMAFFLAIYEVNSEYLQVGGKVSDMFHKYNPDLQYPLRASYDLLTKGYVPSYINEYGNSLDDSEKRVLKEWKRIHEARFQNPYLWKKVCLDRSRNFEMLYNCDNPDQYMFDAVIKRYGELQTAWREQKMKPTMDVFKSWAKKVHSYNGMIAGSYIFYKALLSHKMQAVKENRPSHHMDKDTSAAMRSLVNIMTEGLETEYRDSWSSLFLRDNYEFIIASAVCGPEAEPFGETGRLGSIYNYFFAGGPTKMGTDSMWSDIQFFPPRIVQPLEGNKVLCDNPYGESGLPTLMPSTKYPLDKFPYNKNPEDKTWGSWATGANYARGLENYLMDNIRLAILDENGVERFDDWWNQHVVVPHEKLQADFRAEYEKMLKERFIPALEDKSYYSAGGLLGWCSMNSKEYQIPSLQKHLRFLGTGADCNAEATHRLALGIFNSLEDELRLYSALMLDLNESISKQENKDMRDTLLAAAELLQDMQKHLTTIDRKSRTDIKELTARFGEIVNVLNQHHEKLINERSEPWKKSSNGHVSLWNRTLQDQFNSIFIQAAEYTKILINFEVSEAGPVAQEQ